MIDWDDLFMAMVYLTAMKSKDKNTHVGAVIVDDKHRVVSVGYNGLARGLNDDLNWRQSSPEKYFWFEHAERNAVYNAKRNLEGCIMYTNGIPCSDCARAVIQSGIKEVITHTEWDKHNKKIKKWLESCDKGRQMLVEAGVKLRCYDKPIIDISAKRFGKELKIR